jgi:TonB family protein
LGTVSGGIGCDVAAADQADNPDESLILSTLKNLVAAGEHRLDPMLAAIADAALLLTSASGVALAMWRDGAMVCRARSGETAPALDAQLSAEAGISGECLRTGKSQHCPDTEDDPLVDVEVCRLLGSRSIAVAPIQGRRRINGILEVFSTASAAFSEHHLAVLEQLAALAERAHALQPAEASPVIAALPLEELKPQELLPASQRGGGVALAFLGRRSRSLALGAVGLAATSLLGFVIWLGWRGYNANRGKAQASAPSSASAITRPPETRSNVAGSQVADTLWDNHPTSKPNPGVGMLVASGSAPVTGTLVKANSKVGGTEGKKTPGDQLLSQHAPRSDTGAQKNSSGASHGEEAVPVAPPPIAGGPSPSALEGILSAKAVLPSLSPTLSQGVSGGRLLHRVPPDYPAQAKMFRLEGKVILNAMVMEDGSVRDLKVVRGEAVLAQSAVEAVKQWRYQPFVLNGKPVKTETRITVEFKLPSGSHSTD